MATESPPIYITDSSSELPEAELKNPLDHPDLYDSQTSTDHLPLSEIYQAHQDTGTELHQHLSNTVGVGSSLHSHTEDVDEQRLTFENSTSPLVSFVLHTKIAPTLENVAAISQSDAILEGTFRKAWEQTMDDGFWDEEWEIDDLTEVFMADLKDMSSSGAAKTDVDVLQLNGKEPIPKPKKVDVPLVDSDVESDTRAMTDISRWKSIRLKRLGRKMLWKDNGLGLGDFGWTKKVIDGVKEFVQAVEDTILIDELDGDDYIHTLWVAPDMVQDQFEGLNEKHRLGRATRLHLTPPLSPAPCGDDLEMEEMAEIHLDMISEGEDADARDLNKFQSILAKDDALASSNEIRSPEDLARIYSPMDILEDVPPEIDNRGIRLAEIRVEVPLSSDPIDSMEQELKLADLHFMGDKSANVLEPDSNPSSSKTDSHELVTILSPFAAHFLHNLENESLTTADSTTRVKVPKLDFVNPVPPWMPRDKEDFMGIPSAPQNDMIVSYLQLISRNFQRWSGAIRIERLLQWIPFPSNLNSAALQETISDKQYVDTLVTSWSLEEGLVTPELVLDTIQESKVCKASCFEDDEIYPQTFNVFDNNVEMLIEEKLCSLEQHNQNNSTSMTPFSKKRGLEERSLPNDRKSRDFDSFFNLDALNRFLDLEDVSPSKRSKLEHYNGPSMSLQQSNHLISSPESSKDISPLLSCPVDLQVDSRFVILSSTIYQLRRSLYRQLIDECPIATFIERDFSPFSFQDVTQIAEEKTHMFTNPAQLASFDPTAEADLLLSPSTGVILTNLQQIQQCSLPGEAYSLNLLFQRVVQVAARHERLIVLVSQGFESETPTLVSNNDQIVLPDILTLKYSSLPRLTVRQTKAFASLCGFTSSLTSNVLIHLVPGGETELSRWLIRQINIFGVDIAIKSEETLWENLFRRIGLNTFAACWILTELKWPNDDLPLSSPILVGKADLDIDQHQLHGLAAFMHMSTEDRVSRFSKVMGGKRVLQRVSRCIDSLWKDKNKTSSTDYNGKELS